MWGDIATSFLLAFIVSFVVTPYTIKLAKKKGILINPGLKDNNEIDQAG